MREFTGIGALTGASNWSQRERERAGARGKGERIGEGEGVETSAAQEEEGGGGKINEQTRLEKSQQVVESTRLTERRLRVRLTSRDCRSIVNRLTREPLNCSHLIPNHIARP